MKKFLKYISLILPIALVAIGCQSEPEYDFTPDTNKSGEITLEAAIENAASRASMVNTGEARWLADDAITVICDDGSPVVFPINGTGNTRKAHFTATLPEGRTLGQYAIYPTTAKLSGSKISFTLPSQIEAAASGSCSLMAATLTEDNKIEFKQMLGYVVIQISNVSDETKSILLTSDKNLSGAISVDIAKGMEEGIAATDGDATITITMPKLFSSTINATIALPVGDYGFLKATLLNADGGLVDEMNLSASRVTITRGLMLSFNAKSILKPIDGTVLVAGNYWALGNLQYEQGSTDIEGFVSGWHIAPHQAYYYHMDAIGDDKTGLTDYSKANHFNFGGIADPFSCKKEAAASLALTDPVFNFSGKMYADQTCTTETKDFAAAKFGDVAFWASNGAYRTPTKADMEALYTKASRVKATYVLNGKTICGTYFFDPAEGEEPAVIDGETRELSDYDLTVGLFLPWSGRGYNGTEFNVYKINSQGLYRTTTVNNPSTLEDTHGVIYRVQSLAEGAYYNKSFGATARYSIRPIYTRSKPIPAPYPMPDAPENPTPDNPTPDNPNPDNPNPDNPNPPTPPTPDTGNNYGSGTPGGEIENNQYNGVL